MNRIVRENYPVSKLPEDLRPGPTVTGKLRVTVGSATRPEANHEPAPTSSFSAAYKHLRQLNFASDSEVDSYVRGLRAD